jgi:hypothetical protein
VPLGFITFERGLLITELPKGHWMSLDANVIGRQWNTHGQASVLMNYARAAGGHGTEGLIDNMDTW